MHSKQDSEEEGRATRGQLLETGGHAGGRHARQREQTVPVITQAQQQPTPPWELSTSVRKGFSLPGAETFRKATRKGFQQAYGT